MRSDQRAAVPAAASPFVGRDRELQQIAERLDDALAGHTGLVLISGEAGIGKTRLVEEAAEAATAREFRVLRGNCWEAGGAPPYWPWLQVLRALGDGGDPTIAGLLGGVAPVHSTATEAQVLLFDAVVRRLAAAAARTPLFVMLEDLHAADRTSLLLTGYIGGALRGARVLVVATHRDGQAWLVEGSAQLLARIGRHGRALQLGPLARGDLAELLQRSGRPSELAEKIHAITEGNPLFVHELLRIGWVPTGGAGSRVPLPDRVAAAIRDHLAVVPPPVRKLLDVAAVIGRACSVSALSGVAGIEPDVASETMAVAVQAGLVQETAPGRWMFSHGLVRETLYHDLRRLERAGLHRRTAETFERLHAGDTNPRLGEIAHHLLQAGPACSERAIELTARAAERAGRVLAYDDAAALLERALEVLEQSAPSDIRRRAGLLLALAETQARAGNTDAGRQTSLRVVELARRLDDGALLARAALGYGSEIRAAVVDKTLVGLLEEALAVVGEEGEESALRARLMARLAGALQPAFDPWQPVELARKAIAQARGQGDPDLLLAVLRDAGAAMTVIVPAAERIPLDEELVRLAALRGDDALVLRGRMRLVFDYIERASADEGDDASSESQLRACESLASELGRPHFTWPVIMLRAVRDNLEGRFTDGEQRVAEARRVAERARDASATRCLALHRLHTLRLQGRYRDAAAMLPEVSRATGGDPVMDAVLAAAVWPLAGDVERARPTLARLVDPSVGSESLALIACLDAILMLADDQLIEQVYSALLPASGTLVSWGPSAMHVEGPADGALMRLAARIHRWDDATRHAADALAITRRVRARPHEAWVLAHWGAAVRHRGQAGDEIESSRILDEAAAIATELGMTGLTSPRHRAP